jgi:membrane protein involved in colicin uptake
LELLEVVWSLGVTGSCLFIGKKAKTPTKTAAKKPAAEKKAAKSKAKKPAAAKKLAAKPAKKATKSLFSIFSFGEERENMALGQSWI